MMTERIKQLETLRSRLQELESSKQKLTMELLEVQGAAKQLIELVNLQKEEERNIAADKVSKVEVPSELIESRKGKKSTLQSK